ncbi:MAG: ATP-binding protein [Candidatus Limnocylindrales bacterium]
MRRRRSTGQSLAEFAIVLPVFRLVLSAIIQFGLIFWGQNTLNQLLTVSRLEAGTLRPQIDVFALAPLIQRAWESLGPGERPFQVRDDAPRLLAAADRDWIEQVVWALLDNAVRYGQGQVEVHIVQADHELATTIRDQGPGIQPQDRERVFERFARLDPQASEGTGLGLPVARGLVETMGGRLWLADPGEGSPRHPGASFVFTLPAEPIEEP